MLSVEMLLKTGSEKKKMQNAAEEKKAAEGKGEETATVEKRDTREVGRYVGTCCAARRRRRRSRQQCSAELVGKKVLLT